MENRISRRRFIALGATALASASLASFSLSGCSSSSSEESTKTLQAAKNTDSSLTETIFIFDTVVQITAYCEQTLLDKARERCEYFENILSTTIATSDVAKINMAGGATVTVANETADLIAKSLDYCAISGGKFDITIGTVSTLWDFDNAVKPDDAAIQAALPHIGYQNVQVDGNTVTLLDPETKIDLGAIAKGYIADDLAQLLLAGGCTSALINLGGNVYVVGTKPDGNDWNIGIQDPNDSRGNTVATVLVADQSVVTSGLYERHFVQDGVDYYHILDPKTGYPVVTDLESSSVISDKSIDGDAYSTILFLNGVEASMQIAESTPAIEVILIDDQGNITQSSGADATIL